MSLIYNTPKRLFRTCLSDISPQWNSLIVLNHVLDRVKKFDVPHVYFSKHFWSQVAKPQPCLCSSYSVIEISLNRIQCVCRKNSMIFAFALVDLPSTTDGIKTMYPKRFHRLRYNNPNKSAFVKLYMSTIYLLSLIDWVGLSLSTFFCRERPWIILTNQSRS